MNEREILGSLLDARSNIRQEIHKDYCRVQNLAAGNQFVVEEEEVLPIDQTICVIGTFDQSLNGLTPATSRRGPNLMVYNGSVKEVLERVGNDLKWYVKIATCMVGIGAACLLFALLPSSITALIPLLGKLVNG